MKYTLPKYEKGKTSRQVVDDIALLIAARLRCILGEPSWICSVWWFNGGSREKFVAYFEGQEGFWGGPTAQKYHPETATHHQALCHLVCYFLQVIPRAIDELAASVLDPFAAHGAIATSIHTESVHTREGRLLLDVKYVLVAQHILNILSEYFNTQYLSFLLLDTEHYRVGETTVWVRGYKSTCNETSIIETLPVLEIMT